MPNVIVEITGVASITIEGEYCTYGSKYGLNVSDKTLETLKAYKENGYIKLTIADEPASDILKGEPNKSVEPVVTVEEPITDSTGDGEQVTESVVDTATTKKTRKK